MPGEIQRVAYRKLIQLDAATRLDTLRVPPGNRLEALSGHRRGQHSIRINDQWRICFVWHDGDAYDLSRSQPINGGTQQRFAAMVSSAV